MGLHYWKKRPTTAKLREQLPELIVVGIANALAANAGVRMIEPPYVVGVRLGAVEVYSLPIFEGKSTRCRPGRRLLRPILGQLGLEIAPFYVREFTQRERMDLVVLDLTSSKLDPRIRRGALVWLNLRGLDRGIPVAHRVELGRRPPASSAGIAS